MVSTEEIVANDRDRTRLLFMSASHLFYPRLSVSNYLLQIFKAVQLSAREPSSLERVV